MTENGGRRVTTYIEGQVRRALRLTIADFAEAMEEQGSTIIEMNECVKPFLERYGFHVPPPESKPIYILAVGSDRIYIQRL